MLEERFNRFSDETQKIGRERVDNVNEIADQLIGTGHSDASTIAEWKDGLNEAWVNLLELLKTRKEVCYSCYFAFFNVFRSRKHFRTWELLPILPGQDKIFR